MKAMIGDNTIASCVKPADTFLGRFKGLMGKKRLHTNEGLMLFHCSAVHSFFMKIPIDAIYLSADMRVLGFETLKPWSIGKIYRGTEHVLELPAGSATGRIAVDDTLKIVY